MAPCRLGKSFVTVPAILCFVSAMPTRDPPSTKGVIAQLFSWHYKSVATECQDFLGPTGFRFVQVSPPQEHIKRREWWAAYQPVSYNIASDRGTLDEFKAMVQTCNEAKVGVLVDLVMNHMSAHDDNQGTAFGSGGTMYSHHWYENLWDADDFHHEPGGIDYNNRHSVQWANLLNLADLATEKTEVQEVLANYARSLLDMGVEGFRVDAAKHIPATDLEQIFRRVNAPSSYLTLEVLSGDSEPIRPEEYEHIGDVQEFRYVRALRHEFLKGEIVRLLDVNQRGWIPSKKANTMVTNHDTERDGEAITWASPQAYILATAWILSYPYGTPTVFSGYEFNDKDAGPPKDGLGGGNCYHGSGWNCEHRQAGIREMVGFYNEVAGEDINGILVEGGNRVAFNRGSKGCVAFNNMKTPWTFKMSTTLPDGPYFEVVDVGIRKDGTCSGRPVEISQGSLQITVGAYSTWAIHTGARPAEHSSMTTAKFCRLQETTPGQDVYVLGPLCELGSDGPENAVKLTPEPYPWWQVDVSLPKSRDFTYQYLVMDSDGKILAESGKRTGRSESGWADQDCDSWIAQ